MTDDDLDRRLLEAMRVTPSPDLAARVRARVAGAPDPASAWTWRPAVAAALAALAIVALVAWPQSPLQTALTDGPGRPAHQEAASTPTPVPPSTSPNVTVPPAPRLARRSSLASPASALPVLAAVGPDTFGLAPSLGLADQDAAGPSVPGLAVDVIELPRLAIAPLEIAPLIVTNHVSAGESQ